MNDNDDTGSDLGPEQPIKPTSIIDFAQATKLERSGSTCDAYVTKYKRRRVFVKRLKPKFRFDPRHRAALDKEFDVGAQLAHVSLPHYWDIQDDYIVMDYVDGVTVADMVASGDDWIRHDGNVRKILNQLIDVVDYLHRHHVVHCDIKADNVMLTHGTRDVMLVDLGYCYTDWFDDTSGTPRNYGLPEEEKGNPDMDYRGIGRILDSISAVSGVGKFARFRRLCDRAGVTADELRDELNRKRRPYIWIAAAVIALGVTAVSVFYLSPRHVETSATPATASPDTAAIQPDTIQAIETVNTRETDVKAQVPVKVNVGTPHTDNAAENIGNEGQQDGLPTQKELNAVIAPMLATLKPSLDKLETLTSDSSLSGLELLDILRDYADMEHLTISAAFKQVQNRFPALDYVTVYNVFYTSDAYRAYIHRSDRIQREVNDEFKLRSKAEKEGRNKE